MVKNPGKVGENRLSGGRTLYERLGGYDTIASIMEEYVKLIRADRRFARFQGGRSNDKKMRDLQLNIDYMCKVTGGSNYYMGRDLKTSHAGLGITREEWDANVRYMKEALEKCRIPKREKGEVLAIWKGFRKDVVEGE
jgi:hemoglobin